MSEQYEAVCAAVNSIEEGYSLTFQVVDPDEHPSLFTTTATESEFEKLQSDSETPNGTESIGPVPVVYQSQWKIDWEQLD